LGIAKPILADLTWDYKAIIIKYLLIHLLTRTQP